MIKKNKDLLDSNKVKTYLINHLIWRLGYLGAVTEHENHSDVFGVRRNFYTVEFEIKLSWGDLKREVNIIKTIIKNKNIRGCVGSNTKVCKHGTYLGYWRISEFYRGFIPNEFNFIVPIEFGEIKKELEGTPYGLYTIRGYTAETYNPVNYKVEKIETFDIEQAIRPKKLNKNKIRVF